MKDEPLGHEVPDEIETISRMLHTAELEGMQVEVVWSFANFVRAGDDYATAAACALNEWDI